MKAGACKLLGVTDCNGIRGVWNLIGIIFLRGASINSVYCTGVGDNYSSK
jgi:hypothetical protein